MEGRRPQPSSAPFHNAGRDQINAPGGTANKSDGSGNHLPGATFNAPVSFGKSAPAGSQSLVANECQESPIRAPRPTRLLGVIRKKQVRTAILPTSIAHFYHI